MHSYKVRNSFSPRCLYQTALLEAAQNVNSGEIAHTFRTYSHSEKRKKTGQKYSTLSVRNGAESSNHYEDFFLVFFLMFLIQCQRSDRNEFILDDKDSFYGLKSMIIW